jgi:hypothetical protein
MTDDSSNSIELKSALIYLVDQYYQATNKHISKTKLLKLLYLSELFYFRKYRKQITNEQWIYYHFGPYITGYDQKINGTGLEVEKNINYDAQLVHQCENKEYLSRLEASLPFEVKQIVKSVISEFGKQSLEDILNFVYFETEPMQKVDRRGENLNFLFCRRSEEYRVLKLTIDKKTTKDITEKYRERLQNASRL